MLYHVGAEKRIGKTIHRGTDCEPERGQAEEKRRQPPCVKLCAARFPEYKPSADINNDAKQHHRREKDRWRPLFEDGLAFGRHWRVRTAGLMFAGGWRLPLRRGRPAGLSQFSRGIDGRREIAAAQCKQKMHQCSCLRGVESVAISRHVPAAL